MKWISKIAIVCAGMLALVSCGRLPGPDTDGDGLFDLQELLFGTNVNDGDSDRDGVPDGADDDPLSGNPVIKLTASPAFRDEGEERCVVVGVQAIDGRGNGVKNAEVKVEWGLGEISDVVTDEYGATRLKACAAEQADTVLTAESSDLGGRVDIVRATLDLSLKHLVVPGINTSPDEEAGKVDGHMKVTALFRNGSGLLKPFEGASVYVKPASGEVPFLTTGPAGVVEFVDEALQGPVDVSVGAPGHRYVTYFGVTGASVSVVLDPLDTISEDAATGFGTLTGTVKGFFGETGLERFPKGVLFGGPRLPVGIVQLAINGRPLSSMSMGSVLEEPAPDALLDVVPSNFAICEIRTDDAAACEKEPTYSLRNVPEGQHLLFVLGGTVGEVYNTIQDPYLLDFAPRALGISRVVVEGGKVTRADLEMTIDLTESSGETVDIKVGNMPTDPKTGLPLPNALVMPVIDTGGEGFIFVSVNGDLNRGITAPVKVRFPEQDDPTIRGLGLTLTNLAVGLAGRESYLGGDPPGISTPVRPGVKPGDQVDFTADDVWLDVPVLKVPAPVGLNLPLDTVSADTFDGSIAWKPVEKFTSPDLYVIRLNYLTAAPLSFCSSSHLDSVCTLGGPKSHALWELFVPKDLTSVTLPTFPEGFPTPYLGNPDPTPADSTSPHRFDEDTIEVELSAYVLGADGKDFDYSQNFAYSDVNMHCTVVSQDSVPVKLKK